MAARANAAVLTAARSIELRDFPVPEPIEGGAVVRVEGTGICGSDWAPYLMGPLRGGGEPVILGHEIVGTVEKISAEGAARWGLAEGDRIVVEEAIPCGHCELCRTGRYRMCDGLFRPGGMRYGMVPVSQEPHLWGGFGELMYLHPRSVVHRVAPTVPVEIAPLYIPLSNGIEWVQELGRARSGSHVVILGPGQHGLGCVVGARLAGAATVTVAGTSRDRERLDAARALGATHVVDVDEEDLVGRVEEITGGHFADVVVEVASGTSTTVPLAIEVAAMSGTVVLAGIKEFKPVDGIVTDKVVFKDLTIRGAYGHDYPSVAAAVSLINAGELPLEVLCTHTFGLDAVDDALRTLGGEGEDAIHITVVPTFSG